MSLKGTENLTQLSPKEKPFEKWRYPASIGAFILIYFLLPAAFGIALMLTNLITPPYFKSTEIDQFVLANSLAAATGFYAMEGILKHKKYIFQSIWAAIVAAYSFFVAITNWVLGYSSAAQFAGMISMGIVSLVFVALSCKNYAKEKNSNQNGN